MTDQKMECPTRKQTLAKPRGIWPKYCLETEGNIQGTSETGTSDSEKPVRAKLHTSDGVYLCEENMIDYDSTNRISRDLIIVDVELLNKSILVITKKQFPIRSPIISKIYKHTRVFINIYTSEINFEH